MLTATRMATPPRARADLCKPSNWAIAQLPGLSTQDEASLIACGIQTTFQLLQKTQTIAQRQTLATQIQSPVQRINKWMALAHLACIPSVGCQYCGLLLHAGVTSPTQLAAIPVARLHRQMLRLQIATMQRPDLCPGLDQVSQWVEQAKLLAIRLRQG